MTNIDRAAGIIRAMVKIENPTHDTDVAQALDADGLLMPDQTIIRTVEELQALDQETPLWSKNAGYLNAAEFLNAIEYDIDYGDDLPAVVITTAAQVRAAHKALEEE